MPLTNICLSLTQIYAFVSQHDALVFLTSHQNEIAVYEINNAFYHKCKQKYLREVLVFLSKHMSLIMTKITYFGRGNMVKTKVMTRILTLNYHKIKITKSCGDITLNKNSSANYYSNVTCLFSASSQLIYRKTPRTSRLANIFR